VFVSENKKKIEGKNKRTPCMPVVKFGACVYPRTHPETKTEKKRFHPGNFFNLQCIMNETEEKGGGRIEIE
jgi:hypothetical protein